MKKNRQRGFMLAETFIVSTLVLGVLVYMYIQVTSIMNSYEKSFSYDTIQGIYITKEISNFIVIHDYNNLKKTATGPVKLDSYYNDEVWKNLLKESNVRNIWFGSSTSLKQMDPSSISSKLKGYLKYIEATSSNVVLIEFNDDTFASLRV